MTYTEFVSLSSDVTLSVSVGNKISYQPKAIEEMKSYNLLKNYMEVEVL